jgi:hypothetical protein
MYSEELHIVDTVYFNSFIGKISNLHITEQNDFSAWFNLDRTYGEWLEYWEKKIPEFCSLLYFQYGVYTLGRIPDEKWLSPISAPFFQS